MKDGELSRNGRFRWVAAWATWVPVETGRDEVRQQPPTILASAPARAHADCGLDCVECWNAGVRMADYLENRGLWGNGGLR